jgi:2-dehydro-3-deoxyphosphooctonate aldolase (KDO 8-P synthase)
VGVAGIFIETHNDPDNAPSDGPNMLHIENLENLISKLIEFDNISKK